MIVSSTQTNANPALFVGTNGNVGIGTTAPSTTLHVNGAATINSNTTVSGTLKIAGTGNEGCTPGDVGRIRQNPLNNSLEICKY